LNELNEILNQTNLGPLSAFVFGLVLGSFFNVVILRLPEDQPMAWERSRCPKCKDPIPWYLNIPVLSYMYLVGRCRRCKARISLQYPIVELTTGFLFLFLFHRYGFTLRAAAYALFTSYLLIITVIDIHHQIIPDELSLSGIVLGFLLSFVVRDISWWESGLGILLGGGVFLAIAFIYEKWSGREGLGGGDVKLLGMIGAWLGYQCLLPVIVISSATGSVVGLTLMAVRQKDFKTAIPFGPFLALGALLELIWGTEIHALIFPSFF
jgi:leader peptidase (prepilin peptidase) / N-methyltransferase